MARSAPKWQRLGYGSNRAYLDAQAQRAGFPTRKQQDAYLRKMAADPEARKIVERQRDTARKLIDAEKAGNKPEQRRLQYLLLIDGGKLAEELHDSDPPYAQYKKLQTQEYKTRKGRHQRKAPAVRRTPRRRGGGGNPMH